MSGGVSEWMSKWMPTLPLPLPLPLMPKPQPNRNRNRILNPNVQAGAG